MKKLILLASLLNVVFVSAQNRIHKHREAHQPHKANERKIKHKENRLNLTREQHRKINDLFNRDPYKHKTSNAKIGMMRNQHNKDFKKRQQAFDKEMKKILNKNQYKIYTQDRSVISYYNTPYKFK